MAKKVTKAAKIESYLAHASVKTNASAAAIQSACKIEARFQGGLTPSAATCSHGFLAAPTDATFILETAVDCLEDPGIASQTGTWFPGLKQRNSE